MLQLGKDVIGTSSQPPFFEVARANDLGFDAPALRKGDALRSYVRTLDGFQKEALVRSSKTGQAWRLVSDEGAYLNGHDRAPCPLAFMASGIAASYLHEIHSLAALQGVTIRHLKLTLNSYFTMTGSMPKRTMVGGAEPLDLKVEIECDLENAALNVFLMNALRAAPVHGLIRTAQDNLFTLKKNTKPLLTGQATPLAGLALAQNLDAFANIATAQHAVELMSNLGSTPHKQVTGGTKDAASSLALEQDRRLNIAAAATLREDGIAEIQHMQYSPHGTSFQFLSAQDGRAPDANTLISAGIGFSLMTQFGRFASMLDLDLPEYQIIQDTHFSLGGASGGTLKAATADPVETHVALTTSEPDHVAQEMLEIAERTCFLHALCRQELTTKLNVVRV